MKIPKASDSARSLFDRLVPNDDQRIQVKPMFGNVGAFVNGNMFMGVFGEDIGVKLSDRDQQSLRDLGGDSFGPEERPMGGYVTLPPTLSADESAAWVGRSIEYVGALPVKIKKSSTAR
jgi:TfoX/Sxy family transcriptional regulator of competence genes